jgi:hypothetical protein
MSFLTAPVDTRAAEELTVTGVEPPGGGRVCGGMSQSCSLWDWARFLLLAVYKPAFNTEEPVTIESERITSSGIVISFIV